MTRAKANEIFWLLLVICFFAVIVYVSWVGYIGSDDKIYIINAKKRVADTWLVGANHWDVRITLTLPMAFFFSILGESEFTSALPTLSYFLFLVLAVYVYLLACAERLSAVLSTVLVASSPLLAINATSLRIDTVETFFVIVSLGLFLLATDRRHKLAFMFAAGVMSGLAFITRPTTVALLFFYFLLFLYKYRIERINYLAIALGFLFVWMSEAIYYYFETGRLFYRLQIDFHHDQVIRSGSLIGSVLIEPIKMLLTSHSFGFIYWLFPIACWSLIKGRLANSLNKSLLGFLAAFSCVWIVIFSAFSTKLVLDPRYLAPATVATIIVVSFWIKSFLENGQLKKAVGLLSLVFIGNLLAIHLENKEFMYAERWLVDLTTSHQELIYTDPQTFQRASFLLDINGTKDNVVPAPPPVGALFLSVPKNARRGQYDGYRWSPNEFSPGEWNKIETIYPQKKILGVILMNLGLLNYIPTGYVDKFYSPNPPITLFRRSLELNEEVQR